MRRPAVLLFLPLIGAALWAGCRSPASEMSATAPRLYVSGETGGNVDAVDPASGQLMTKIAVGKRPRGIARSRDGKLVYVTLWGSPIGGPGVDESKLPPADRSADGIGVIDVSQRRLVRKFRSGIDPEAFGLSPDGKTLYVSNEDSGEMSAVDLNGGDVVWHVKVGSEPEGVAVRPDNKVIYSLGRAKQLAEIEPATRRVERVLDDIGARPWGIAMSRDGRRLHTANGASGDAAIVDVQSGAVLQRISAGGSPWGVALSEPQ